MRTKSVYKLQLNAMEARMAQARTFAWEAAQGSWRTVERFTKKQMGDAGEMLVAAELTLHGIPAFITPSGWRSYDVVAQCPKRGLQRISVKTRRYANGNFVAYSNSEVFDWLAIVILPRSANATRRIFIVPRDVANIRSYESPQWNGRGFLVHEIIRWPAFSLPDPRSDGRLADYEDNFNLSVAPRRERKTRPRFHAKNAR
jgi:hypothetical protein